MFKEIIDLWKFDENGNATFQKVVGNLKRGKAELFNRAMNFFIQNYADVDSVILDRDLVNGIIIGKGIFKKVHFLKDVLQSVTIDTLYLLKVEVKDGSARITVTLTQYDEIVKGGELPGNHYLYPISSQYPINPTGYGKDLYEQSFYKSHLKALETVASLESALGGNITPGKDEKW